MGDMTATDELRRLLDERGVEYTTNDGEYVKETCWPYMGELMAAFAEFEFGKTRFACDTWCFTPEQAIDATLGAGTCRRVRGHRSYRTQGGYRIECSGCGYGLADRRYRYCPNCGRRIVEVSE